jgi:outer membrane protein TolC
MKSLIVCVFFLWSGAGLASAQLSLPDCQRKARENYPLIRKYGLIERARDYDASNAAKAWLPQFQLNIRASYQSDVTRIPVDFSALRALGIPMPEIPAPARDQYAATVEAGQVLWDGGGVRAQQEALKAGSEVSRNQLEVEMYALEEKVNDLFFGVLLLNEQLKLNRLLMDELDRNLLTLRSYIGNGVANAADLDVLRVEQLNAGQTQTQLLSARKAFVEMLGRMMGEVVPENAAFVKPEAATPVRDASNRPEFRLFEAQNGFFNSQKRVLRAASMPRLGLFLQGGYGRPGLDMLSDRFDLFYVGGVKLSWNFGSLYTQKNDLRKIEINQKTVDVQRDLFAYSIDLAVSRETQEIERLRRLLRDDDEIIALRENIRKAAEAKVANGTATVTDLMRDLTRENLARQTKIAHEIDLLAAIYHLKNTTNN